VLCVLPKSPPDAGAEVAGTDALLPNSPLDVVVGVAAGLAEDAAAPNELDDAVVLLFPKRPPPLGAAGLAALPNRPPVEAGCCCWPNGEAADVAAAPVFPPNRPPPLAGCAGVDPLMAPLLPKEKLGVPVDAAPKRPPEEGAVVVVAGWPEADVEAGAPKVNDILLATPVNGRYLLVYAKCGGCRGTVCQQYWSSVQSAPVGEWQSTTWVCLECANKCWVSDGQ
jgi:hypothetical protein